MLLGRAAGTSGATPLWIACLLVSALLAGFSALTILGIGMLIAPLAIVLPSHRAIDVLPGQPRSRLQAAAEISVRRSCGRRLADERPVLTHTGNLARRSEEERSPYLDGYRAWKRGVEVGMWGLGRTGICGDLLATACNLEKM